MSKKETNIKIETMGKGVIVEVDGEKEDLKKVFRRIFTSLLISDVIPLDDLIQALEDAANFMEFGNKNDIVTEHIDVEDPEEANQKVKEFIKKYMSQNIKRKCLICPEKDVCDRKSIDIECTKY